MLRHVKLSWMSFSRSTRPLWPAPDANCASSSSSLLHAVSWVPHMPSVCEKSIQLLADLQPSCSDQAFKSNQTQKISGVFEKKKLQTVPKIFSHQKHGESIFSMSKKTNVSLFLSSKYFVTVDLHHLGCQHPQVSSGQYGRHWCLPIHSWISTLKTNKPRLKEKWHWILVASGSGILIVA